MKKINLLVFAFLMAFMGKAQTAANFENLTLATDTFWDGSNLSGGFSSGNAYFLNYYDTTYNYWDGGFIYSNKTDSVTSGYTNNTSAITASGYNGSANYAVANGSSGVQVNLTGSASGGTVKGFYVTNCTYAYRSMLNGDMFAKKFGGVSGNDPDWFKLTVKAWYNGTLKNAAVDFYLADYRFSNNTQDYIVRDWRWVDLTSLGNVDSLAFFLSSSDTGSFGMNTPAYYCIDNFTTADRANGGPTVADGNITITYSQDTLINVIGQYVTDTSGEALTVQIISGPLISGASAVVDSNNNIWYLPNIGIVAVDTITYSVCDIDNHCDTAQLFINITGLEGINDIAKLNAAVWPNPFNASLSVATKQGVDELSLYDLTGRLIMQERHPQSTAPIMLNTASLPAGLYLLKVIVGNSVATVKVTKQ